MAKKRYNIDLPAHLAECDANYLRLMKLFPLLRVEDVSVFGVVVGQHPSEVRIQVLERSPYTTHIRLTQLPSAPWSKKPSLTVRMYHDARSAEVVEYQHARHFQAVYDYPNPTMRQPDEKVQINRFLGEFLALCLEHGVAVKERVLVG
ncbi:MAG: DUF1249 domain-containing protein [Gammaproteobacteria bacterium]|nr:DUF1249 domain-containing protein [Gammaproteobacteria bacterium]MCZ6854151.1 DUF1249 domain-containing protein [Gammaproteobacteria bacterium]